MDAQNTKQNAMAIKPKQPKRKSLIGRLFTFVWKILLSLIIIIILLVIAIWHNEILTLLSIKEIMPKDVSHQDGYVYEMRVFGDYYLDALMAKGGVKSDQELIRFLSGKITKNLFNLDINYNGVACSSFTSQSKEGDILFARNYDLKRTNTAIVKTNPGKGKYSSISTVDLSFLSASHENGLKYMRSKLLSLAAAYVPLDGMNEKGVSAGIYMTYQGPFAYDTPTNQNTDKPDIISTLLIRLILDHASNVEEAVEIAKSYDMHDSIGHSFHYMVADSSGKSAILEWITDSNQSDTKGYDRTLRVIYNTDSAPQDAKFPYQVITNFIVYPAYYQAGDFWYGQDRYDLMHSSLHNSSGLVENEESAMALLQRVGRRHWSNDDSNSVTVHSVVYNLSDRSIYWIANERFSNPDYSYRFRFR